MMVLNEIFGKNNRLYEAGENPLNNIKKDIYQNIGKKDDRDINVVKRNPADGKGSEEVAVTSVIRGKNDRFKNTYNDIWGDIASEFEKIVRQKKSSGELDQDKNYELDKDSLQIKTVKGGKTKGGDTRNQDQNPDEPKSPQTKKVKRPEGDGLIVPQRFGGKKKLSPSDKKLIQQDHENTDGALLLTQDKKSGLTDVGLGTPESRAGEAAVHYFMRGLANGKSEDEIYNELSKIASDKKRVLTPTWVESARAAARTVAESIPPKEVQAVVWDTPQGREAIGVEGHDTSSDFFILTKKGERVGISLKADEKVFLANKGYSKSFEEMVETLSKEGVSEKSIKIMKKNASPETFGNDLQNRTKYAVKDVLTPKVVKTITNKLEKGDPKIAKSIFGSNYKKYLDALSNPDLHKKAKVKENDSKDKRISNDEIKAIARILEKSNVLEENKIIPKKIADQFSERYNDIRAVDQQLTSRLLKSFESAPDLADGIKGFILHGMHLESILGIDENPSLDKFVTVYGIQPDGVELSPKSLMELYGKDFQTLYESLQEQWAKTKNPKEKEKLSKQLIKDAKDRIYIDYKDGAKDGVIKIKDHDNNEFPVFTIRTRSRGIGSAPTLEIAQSSFMGHSLKNGSFYTDNWEKPAQLSYFKSQLKTIKSEMVEEGNSKKQMGQYKARLKEITAKIKSLNESKDYRKPKIQESKIYKECMDNVFLEIKRICERQERYK